MSEAVIGFQLQLEHLGPQSSSDMRDMSTMDKKGRNTEDSNSWVVQALEPELLLALGLVALEYQLLGTLASDILEDFGQFRRYV